MNREALASCFGVCQRQHDAINPYDHMIDLTYEESEIIMKGHYDLEVTRRIEELSRAGKGEFTCFCGGIFVIRRAVYGALGGFDERFMGWGGEDDAMTYKMVSLVKSLKTMQNQKAFHLWHERNPKAMYGHPHYQNNLKLISEYRNCGKGELLQLCEDQAKSLGNVEKYAGVAAVHENVENRPQHP
jgi:predicted glycosyltransferase involved in capsule biosynthesis